MMADKKRGIQKYYEDSKGRESAAGSYKKFK
jgi:hypothetical protein